MQGRSLMRKTILFILLAVVSLTGFFGYKYYDASHNGTPYYAMVTNASEIERPLSDDDQESVLRYDYQFNAKDSEGVPRELDVIAHMRPLTEGTWLKITASKLFVNNVEAISAREVPSQAK